MTDIKLWVHDGSTYMTPHWISSEKSAVEGIKEWGDSVFEYAKESGKQHCVFATRETTPEGNTCEVNYYCVCLDDDEFFKRTGAVINEASNKGNSLLVYAFHKGTHY